MNDNEIKELVEKLDHALGKHNLTFDEYLLYKALHAYENRNEEVMKSLEDKGLIKDNKIVDHSMIKEAEKTIEEFFMPVPLTGELTRTDYLSILSFLYMSKPGARPW